MITVEMFWFSFKCSLLPFSHIPKIIKVYSGTMELWYPKIYKAKELLNAKAVCLSFPGSAETEEGKRMITDLAMM